MISKTPPDNVEVATVSGGKFEPLYEREYFARASRNKVTIPSTTTTVVNTTTSTRVVVKETTVPSTSTTRPKPITTVTQEVKPVAAPNPSYDPACLGHAMQAEEAHRCWDGLITQYPWNHAKAFSVMMCESSGKSNASNGSHWGLFQLDRGPYYDPAVNIEKAYREYYVPRGWRPWACA